jgi:hypothetical protein
MMEGFDPIDTDPARRLRDAADAAEAGNLMDAQIFAGQALDALLEARADQEDLVSDLGDALENVEGVPMLEEAALDEDTPVPEWWSEGGLHRDDVPALLARELATLPATEVGITVRPEHPGRDDHHYTATFEIVSNGVDGRSDSRY